MKFTKLIDSRKARVKKARVKKAAVKLKDALAQQSVGMKEMLKTYFNYTHGKATKEDMLKAEGQFQDFLKTLGLGVFAVLPFAPITIPVIIKVADKHGVDIIPTAFKS